MTSTVTCARCWNLTTYVIKRLFCSSVNGTTPVTLVETKQYDLIHIAQALTSQVSGANLTHLSYLFKLSKSSI